MGFQPMQANPEIEIATPSQKSRLEAQLAFVSAPIRDRSNTASGELGFLSWYVATDLNLASMGWKPMSQKLRRTRKSMIWRGDSLFHLVFVRVLQRRWILKVELFQRLDNRMGHKPIAIPLVIGRHDVPRRIVG
jgi:hypothetical protein